MGYIGNMLARVKEVLTKPIGSRYEPRLNLDGSLGVEIFETNRTDMFPYREVSYLNGNTLTRLRENGSINHSAWKSDGEVSYIKPGQRGWRFDGKLDSIVQTEGGKRVISWDRRGHSSEIDRYEDRFSRIADSKKREAVGGFLYEVLMGGVESVSYPSDLGQGPVGYRTKEGFDSDFDCSLIKEGVSLSLRARMREGDDHSVVSIYQLDGGDLENVIGFINSNGLPEVGQKGSSKNRTAIGSFLYDLYMGNLDVVNEPFDETTEVELRYSSKWTSYSSGYYFVKNEDGFHFRASIEDEDYFSLDIWDGLDDLWKVIQKVGFPEVKMQKKE